MRDRKYIFYVLIFVGMFLLVQLSRPKQYDWTFTLAHEDKNPYGTYALHELFSDVFDGREVTTIYNTFYEIRDTLTPQHNLVVLASRFSPDPADMTTLFRHVAEGGYVLISANHFLGMFSDTLGLRTMDDLFSMQNYTNAHDSSYLHFVNPQFDTTATYWFRSDNINRYFYQADSSNTTIVAKDGNGNPVTVRVQWGEGAFILNLTPIAFTNIYLISGNTGDFIAKTLSYLPEDRRVIRSEYYQVGRLEVKTPLRFILREEPLAWGYYLLIGSIILFMIFEAKRKQRVIPVIKPLTNTSLEFVTTVGNLYYQKQDHKNVAEKKIAYLLDMIRTKYLLSTGNPDDNFYEALSGKSGKSLEEIRALFGTVKNIQSRGEISAGELMDLNTKLERFYRK